MDGLDTSATAQKTAEALREAIRLNHEFESLAEDGVSALDRVGRVQRGLARATIKRGLYMTPEQLLDEVREASRLLDRIAAGATDPVAVRPRLVRYADVVVRVAQFAESLEPKIDAFVRDPQQRERAVAEGRAKIDLALKLADALVRLAG